MSTTKLNSPYSFLAIIVTSLVLVLLTFVYYPKWKKDRTEATISWDVSGYYFYLPSIFIYKDLKKVGFKQKIQDQYSPASSAYQTYTYANGNEVMKYSSGMALLYSPFFGLGHIGAKVMGAPRWIFKTVSIGDSHSKCIDRRPGSFIGSTDIAEILYRSCHSPGFDIHCPGNKLFGICLDIRGNDT